MTIKQFTHSAYFTAFPQGATVTNRAHGIDFSKYDLYFKPEMATGQLDFGVQRVSYRTTRDEAFLSLVEPAMQLSIRGAYHYLNSDTQWKPQADKFLDIISPYNYHFLVCDFESAFNVMSIDYAYQAWQWIQYVQDRTGDPVLIYTTPYTYTDYLYPSQKRYGIDWNTIDAWFAQWFWIPNPDGAPTNPTGRTRKWKLWQYTDKGNGPLYGVARLTACDLNVFNGTVPEMRTFFKVTDIPPAPPDPPQGGTMNQEGTVLVTKVNIRQGPGTGYPDIGDLFKGDRVIGETDIATGWFFFTRIVHVTGAAESMSGWCVVKDVAGTLCLNVVTIPDVPDPAYPVSAVVTMSDGSTWQGNLTKQ